MSGVDPPVAVHRLYVDPHYKPIKKKKRTFSKENGKAIRREVDKLMGADAIRESLFPAWLANIISVPKPNGTGYHYIFKAEEDVEKMAFEIEDDVWKAMAFGLNNAGATYQRMVNKVFYTQIGRNMEIFVEHMLIKSREAEDHMDNHRESFENLRRNKL
ncbi:hypothetical protein LIER_29016 [Lithospermum erythrorhizon]|uniref:Uncharacterized protein n=1 Tax=Lithospermum erythrorhizon TaxID=34254 RepID=A0AAV3RL04_LITER